MKYADPICRLYRMEVARRIHHDGEQAHDYIAVALPQKWMKNRVLVLRDFDVHSFVKDYDEQDAWNDLQELLSSKFGILCPEIPPQISEWKDQQSWRGTVRKKSGLSLVAAYFEGHDEAGVFYHYQNKADEALYRLYWSGNDAYRPHDASKLDLAEYDWEDAA